MESARSPRFRRSSRVPPIRLTERDRNIIRLVHRNRFLRSSHIVALIGGSSQQILRRLQLLYHHGYLERPRAQIEYYRPGGGSRHIVYGLGNKGATLLRTEGVDVGTLRWGEKNRSVRRMFFDHAVSVSEVMVSLELACSPMRGVRILRGDGLPLSGAAVGQTPPKWKVSLNGRAKIGIMPDRVFALDIAKPDGSINRAFFFLEVDRGTMPVTRKNLVQSSFYRKLLAYEATWTKGLHRTLFGFHRFRVLTVTTSSVRVQSLLRACSKLKRGHGLFLFMDQGTLRTGGNILTLPWRTGNADETATLIE